MDKYVICKTNSKTSSEGLNAVLYKDESINLLHYNIPLIPAGCVIWTVKFDLSKQALSDLDTIKDPELDGQLSESLKVVSNPANKSLLSH